MALKNSRSAFLLLGLSSLCLFLILYLHFPAKNYKTEHYYKDCVKNNSLKVFLFANYSDYFVYRGIPLGFQYELLNILADSLNLALDIDVECDYYNVYSIADEEKKKDYDIIAMEIPHCELLNSLVCKSLPFDTTYPVLVGARKSSVTDDTIRTIYLPANFATAIIPDSLPSPDSWLIEKSSYASVEELFDWLDNERISYIASDYHTAALLLQFYPNLSILKQIGAPYPRQWILRCENDSLNSQINSWLTRFVNSKKYKSLCRKYFSQQSRVQNVPQAKVKTRHISPYDNIVRKHASEIGLDWRFVMSIMYQESKFYSGLYGLGGSFGLMQMMPATCAKYGIDENSSEEEQIIAGVRHIKSIQRFFADINDEREKMLFTAAAYNSGPGHIQDARRLCSKYGDNSNSWEDVSKYLILKAEKEYYTDPVVKCGYYPGRHAATYADLVMERYDSYCLLFK